jgi:hypothetical protein
MVFLPLLLKSHHTTTLLGHNICGYSSHASPPLYSLGEEDQADWLVVARRLTHVFCSTYSTINKPEEYTVGECCILNTRRE